MTYDDCFCHLQRNWGNEGEVDVLQAMQDLTILTASATLLGPEIRHALYEEVHRVVFELFCVEWV